MIAHTLQVSRTARYFTLGEPSENIEQVWIVCHGYGQLAEYFLRNFTSLSDGKTLVVAPEALSRFYLNGTSGRVGATWMTREDRQTEINDYTAYLDSLADLILRKLKPDVKVFVLGFSQGVATVCRWLANRKTPCHGLVLWAGVFPPDLNPEDAFKALHNIPIQLLAGRTDSYITEEAANTQFELLLQNALKPALQWYDGGHEINPELMLSIHRKWANLQV